MIVAVAVIFLIEKSVFFLHLLLMMTSAISISALIADVQSVITLLAVMMSSPWRQACIKIIPVNAAHNFQTQTQPNFRQKLTQ